MHFFSPLHQKNKQLKPLARKLCELFSSMQIPCAYIHCELASTQYLWVLIVIVVFGKISCKALDDLKQRHQFFDWKRLDKIIFSLRVKRFDAIGNLLMVCDQEVWYFDSSCANALAMSMTLKSGRSKSKIIRSGEGSLGSCSRQENCFGGSNLMAFYASSRRRRRWGWFCHQREAFWFILESLESLKALILIALRIVGVRLLEIAWFPDVHFVPNRRSVICSGGCGLSR